MTEDIISTPRKQAEHATFDWGELTWFASRRLGNSADMTIGQCLLYPGKGNPRHHHPNCSEVLVVISGSIRHTSANAGTVEMHAGDTVTIPANVWHNAMNIGAGDAVLFIAFSSADRETIGE